MNRKQRPPESYLPPIREKGSVVMRFTLSHFLGPSVETVTPQQRMRRRLEYVGYPPAGLLSRSTGFPPVFRSFLKLIVEYRTLSIHVSDTVTHGVQPAKGNIKAISELDWHLLPVAEAVQRLGSSETRGLDDNQAQRRLQQYGNNIISPPPTNHIRKTCCLCNP